MHGHISIGTYSWSICAHRKKKRELKADTDSNASEATSRTPKNDRCVCTVSGRSWRGRHRVHDVRVLCEF